MNNLLENNKLHNFLAAKLNRNGISTRQAAQSVHNWLAPPHIFFDTSNLIAFTVGETMNDM